MLYTRTILSLLIVAIAQVTVLADSLDIKIGQMLMVGMPGNKVQPNSPIAQYIKTGIVGGILLFEFNLNPNNTKNELQKLTNNLQDLAPIPLLIAIDQEGGQVNRLKTKYGFPAMPSAKKVADSNSHAYAYQVAETIANTLAECGINLNFAPVADLHNPFCPVLGNRNRCFSDDPHTVATYDSIYIEAHRAAGIKTSLKHFPGHGNSRSDSHLGLTDVSKYWKKNELIPYQKLIQAGMVNMIMSAHIVNKNMDKSGLPATLSPHVIQKILREELGYNGVVISDDMQMHAISSHYSLSESLRMGILAGIDMFIFSNNIFGASDYSPDKLHAAIRKLVENGSITEQRINESYTRIMQLKKSR